MPVKKHRLFTRWFSRKIDLGVIFSGSLFVCIWFFLPAPPVRSTVSRAQTTHIQATRKTLDDVLPYLRPDLVLVPSRYSFAPLWEEPEKVMGIPPFAFTTAIGVRFSEPSGMGDLAALTASRSLNDRRVLLVPPSVAGVPEIEKTHDQSFCLHVRKSDGLGATRLRRDIEIWGAELSLQEPWRFAFWISFSAQSVSSGLSAEVFVEERSGDVERDLRLLRIVERLDAWEHRMGEGLVWLHYDPVRGEVDAN